MVQPGKLDCQIQILRAELIDDGYQQRLGDFSPSGGPVWASKRDVADSERFAGGTVKAALSTRFRLRWYPLWREIRPSDRLRCEGIEYGIVGIKEIGRHSLIEITAVTL